MKRITFILALAGMLFAGYLSVVKFFSDTCALGESCPYFLGYPACYFGFGLFGLIVLLMILGAWNLMAQKSSELSVLAVSAAGILFSGYFTLQEMPALLSRGPGAYVLGLPTCALGLLFYAGIFIITLIQISKSKARV
jgi:hypothetical protein